jgi:TetR/AcrR family transcriptional regulator, regulator of cefoperazone and chloramphenicol sensitivity
VNQRDDDTRSRILEAAGAIFAERGFDKATIRDICARASVNLASANYHFGDKERLYAATIRHAHELANTQVPLPEWPDGTPPEDRFRDFVRAMLQRMLAMQALPWQAQLMIREFVQPTGVCRELADDYIRPHFQILLGILDELLPPETPLYRRHQLGFSVVGQCLFYHLNGPIIELLVDEEERRNHYVPRRLANHIADVMLAAMGRQSLFPGIESPAMCGLPGLHGKAEADFSETDQEPPTT